MALQMATNISPSTFAGVGGGVFDAEKGLKVSWQVNGNSPMTAYQIVLQKYDNNSTNLYTTGRVALASPFYGVLADGTVQYFEAETITAETLASAGIVNGNSYKMVITQWWGNTAAESITQSSAAVIEAWSEPTITINAYDSPITTRTYHFTATYAQEQSDPIVWVRWKLYNRNRGDEIVKDTGTVYGTSQLLFNYDALFTGTIYGIEVTAETQSGQQCTSDIQTVYVNYATAEGSAEITAEQQCGENGVMVHWNSARNILGSPLGAYGFANGALELGENSAVEWATEGERSLTFSAPYSFFWRGVPSPDISAAAELTCTPVTFRTDSGTLAVKMEQYVANSKANVRISLMNGNESIITKNVSDTNLGVEYVIGYSNGKFYYFIIDQNGNAKGNWDVTIPQGTITSMLLTGPQNCSYLWIENGYLSEQTLSDLMTNAGYEPVYTASTYFLTDFQNENLNGGNTDTTGYSLYRIDNGTGEYMHLADLGIDQLGLLDYSAKNDHSYTYQLWYSSPTIFTRAPFTSNTVVPCRWNVVLLAAKREADGVYHPQAVYTFRMNVETKDEINNNVPTVQKNFTRYPNWQPENSLYRTGTLTALIGKCSTETNLYSDSAALADEIMELSSSGYDLFLNDRKGNLRHIRPNGSITMKVEDKWPNQAVTMTFPWVEIGSTEGVAIALTSADALWPVDQIVNTSVSIDNQTGKLRWDYADDYLEKNAGSVLELQNEIDLAQNFTSETVRMAELEINQQHNLIAKT